MRLFTRKVGWKMHTGRLLAAMSATTVMALVFSSGLGLAAALRVSKSVEAALDNITTLNRLRQDGYATIWDGNKYVQCKRLPDRSLRCEAAGTFMQSSLERVLTPERVTRLTALGWRLDPSFGNYVQTFPADAASSFVAERILQVLAEAYNADIAELEVQSTCSERALPATQWAEPKSCRHCQ
jgi:hypothetical protein